MTLLDLKVTTTNGVVQGRRGKRTKSGSVAWRGIPFAAPPVAGRRFRGPQPVTNWPGVRDATKLGKAAIQHKMFTVTAPGRFVAMSEDCLTLNVFSPETASATPRPVMVFIHGGGYILGTAATPIYDGSLLARNRDVVVVSVQYRFGPFGYLDFSAYSTDERTFDNNCGLRDQVAALEWVKRNIGAFGGDPDNVTIFGESAGGSAVASLMTTPAAEGLFERAIIQSPALELVVTPEDSANYAEEFLRLLADPKRRNDSKEPTGPAMAPAEAQRLLGTASAAELFKAGSQLMKYTMATSGVMLPYGPVIDGDYLPRSPIDAARAGTTHKVPLIIGSNRDEGLLFSKLWNIMPEPESLLLRLEDPAMRQSIAALYPSGKQDLIRLAGDAVIWGPHTAFADGHSAVAPTYSFRYDYHTRVLGLTGFRATHATELFAVFGTFRAPIGMGLAVGDWRSTARITSDVQSRWEGFARTGVPGNGWPEYTTEDRKVLVINDPGRVIADPDGERREAWRLAQTAS